MRQRDISASIYSIVPLIYLCSLCRKRECDLTERHKRLCHSLHRLRYLIAKARLLHCKELCVHRFCIHAKSALLIVRSETSPTAFGPQDAASWLYARSTFGKFISGSKEERQHVADSIDAAFRETGFVCLTNHSVSLDKLHKCFKWSQKFFALPEDVKMLAPHPPGGSHHRGYSGVGVEKVTQHVFDAQDLEALRQVPDIKESFESGNVDDAMQPNIWLPEDKLPGFRQFMESFFLECRALIHEILLALATALRLPAEDQLSKTHEQSLFQLRLLHYPPVAASLLADGSKSRISAHSDFGTLTLLFQDAIGGLEVEDLHHPGQFQHIAPVKDAVLVNVGDLMERWSNKRWRSTVHRVVAPPAAEQGLCPPRYSIPFFATADPDTVIEALPGCWDDKDNPKRFESVTAWGYVQMRMAALYDS